MNKNKDKWEIIRKIRLMQTAKKLIPESVLIKFKGIEWWFRWVFYPKHVKKRYRSLICSLKFDSFKKKMSREKRVLGIWDFNVIVPSIGFFIEFQLRLLCSCFSNKVEKNDLVFINDPKEPIVWPECINQSNFDQHFAELLPLLNVNPKLGSVFYFDSHKEFELFYEQNKDKYLEVHPSITEYSTRKYGPNVGTFLYLRNFYLKNKFLPELRFKPVTTMWIKNFIKKNIGNKFMIAVNLRFNPVTSRDRNANIKEWENLFQHCINKKYNAIFVITGRKNEIQNKLKSFPNVIFAKDHNTNVEQDLAIIKNALFYIGITSGPTSFGYFSTNIPYIITTFRLTDKMNNYSWLKPGKNFPWRNPKFHRLIWDGEKYDLNKEFEQMFNILDKEKWRKDLNLDSIDETVLEWPYIKKEEL